MKKRFNITGVCFPELHYMMDNREKLKQVMELIELGEYFTINRPRQYGKTTTLNFLGENLREAEEYLPIELNFQGIDERWHQSDERFAQMFLKQLQKDLKFNEPETFAFLKELASGVQDMDSLSDAITALVHQVNKKIVLLIDEVDASSNFMPFLNFLGMLRTKYLARFKPQHATFFSIVLAGVHDIKTLKFKMRPEDTAEYNSPWNIATDFEVEMRFNPKEIAPMLEDYSQAEGVRMDIPAISERLYYYTSGYPFLVSKLCKIIAEKIIPARDKRAWTMEDVEAAVNLLLQENNTNFDSLIKNLENNEDLYELVFAILVQGKPFSFNVHNPVIHLGVLHGILKNGTGTKIHNRIYEQLIYNYMISKMETSLSLEDAGNRLEVILPNKELEMDKILVKFQEFMKEQYREKDQKFLEREWRLLFLAYLHPILNGGGYTFVEVQISEEKRLDVVVTYFQHKYVIELKRWNGDKLHQKGIQQLSDYLEKQHQQKGYLVIFEYRTEKTWRKETIADGDKDIFAVWV